MENRKSKLILIIILVVVLFTALGYYIAFNVIDNNESEEVNNKNINVENSLESENNTLVSVNNNQDESENIEKYDNVVLTSKIGTKVLSKFCISNIYSNILYDELDKNGLSEDAKLLFTYITINSNYNYHNMINSSEEIGEYITIDDFESVYRILFGSESNITHNEIINDNIYDSENKCYKCLTFGYGGIDFDFIIEIPFEIKEYEDRIEVLFYRIYATANSSINEDGIEKQIVSLYSDTARKNQLYSGNDNRLQYNDSQEEYIRNLIENGDINKEDLQKVTYILKEQGEEFYIDSLAK